MTQTYLRGATATTHRLDLPCERTGFSTPPCDVHMRFLPPASAGAGWTLLAHAAAGKPEFLARWLRPHPCIEQVRVAPGIAPKELRATATRPPAAWTLVASFVQVHHLDLAPDGNAAWFVEGLRDRVFALVHRLEALPDAPPAGHEVRCRPVHAGDAPISRRQFETLATAVALGYYEIPHRVDLRTLAVRAGISLGSVSELLRRAEGAVLSHYVDARLMRWPALAQAEDAPVRVLENPLRH